MNLFSLSFSGSLALVVLAGACGTKDDGDGDASSSESSEAGTGEGTATSATSETSETGAETSTGEETGAEVCPTPVVETCSNQVNTAKDACFEENCYVENECEVAACDFRCSGPAIGLFYDCFDAMCPNSVPPNDQGCMEDCLEAAAVCHQEAYEALGSSCSKGQTDCDSVFFACQDACSIDAGGMILGPDRRWH